jgi:hypothetical protein
MLSDVKSEAVVRMLPKKYRPKKDSLGDRCGVGLISKRVSNFLNLL